MQARRPRKHLCAIGSHPITKIWEDTLVEKLMAILKDLEVQWTSIDVIRIGFVGAEPIPVLWIGVRPRSVTAEHGSVLARCRKLLEENGIVDMDVEVYEPSQSGT